MRTNLEKLTSTDQVFIKIFIRNLKKCFGNYILFNLIPNFFHAEDTVLVIDERVNNKGYEKADTEIETYEKTEEKKFPQKHQDGDIFNLEDLNEVEMSNPRLQAMFKQSRHI